MSYPETDSPEDQLEEVITLFNQIFKQFSVGEEYFQRKGLPSCLPCQNFAFLPENLKTFLREDATLRVCLEPSRDQKNQAVVWYEIVLEGQQTHNLVVFAFNNLSPTNSSVWCVYDAGEKQVDHDLTNQLNQPHQFSERLLIINQILTMILNSGVIS